MHPRSELVFVWVALIRHTPHGGASPIILQVLFSIFFIIFIES